MKPIKLKKLNYITRPDNKLDKFAMISVYIAIGLLLMSIVTIYLGVK